jgi:iron complex outermembrane receptor protein
MNLDKKFARKLLCASVIIATQSQSVMAQDDEKQKKLDPRMEKIIVEGKRIDSTISDIAIDFSKYGTQVQLISADEIATGGFTNFAELAAGLIRGANIGYSPDEGEFTIRIDGGTDRDTLLLLDGMPTFDRGTPLESIWPATSLDPRMIESVEVFRGGQSIYYGGNGGLGVVNAIYKKPHAGAQIKGEFGVYAGSFDTREMYGNIAMPLFGSDDHAIMFFARSYETQSNVLFDREAHIDTVQALGGFHEFPYSYNLIGTKYHWAIGDETNFRVGAQYATVDFRDSFPDRTIYQPNYTEFPMLNLSFNTRVVDNTTFELEGHYVAPILYNTEVDARVCQLPRLGDLPAGIQARAAEQGITGFSNATEFENFANSIEGLPSGCVTNPYGAFPGAAVAASQGYYVDDNGVPYGTLDNPFPIGAPIGYVIQSVAGFGDGSPTKGFGEGDQYRAGYIDAGLNGRFKSDWTDYFQTVFGLQYSTYYDNSDAAYGMNDDKVRTIGLYGDLRFSFDFIEGTSFSVAGRFDNNNAYEDETIWKYGFRQEFPMGIYVRSNGGTSYSNPTLAEIGARNGNINNPSMQTQSVETYSLGLGINGDIWGGTYNFEISSFDTEIDNLFGSASIDRVCPEIAKLNGENNLVANIIPPDAFCAFALAEYKLGNLTGNETSYFNRQQTQEIQGVTLDASIDIAEWQADFTFTNMSSEEPNPIYGLTALEAGTGANLGYIVPGAAGSSELRQSSERPEWSASALLSYTPTDRWTISLNPRWQGPEWAYAGTTQARLVDANAMRTNPDLNFGNYFVLNGSIQYRMGDDLQHRFLLRLVNITDESYFERASASADKRLSTAGVRGEIGRYDSEYYYQYGWNGKPRSVWIQYEYSL